jgi:hypothetical protein
VGTIAISTLDIGAMLVGGLISKFLPKVVAAKCCSGEEKDAVLAKIDELTEDLATLRAAVVSF